MEAIYGNTAVKTVRQPSPQLSWETTSPANQLKEIEKQLDYVHNHFNNAIDPILIDSYIYEIMSLNMKHKYFAQAMKDDDEIIKGI
ncbi:MAG: hypothetical protein LBS62_10730 [Clostridiales bacterium]|jgi:hypothetical protein|nr:hypothetical protein [Clostridiales bacterium]